MDSDSSVLQSTDPFDDFFAGSDDTVIGAFLLVSFSNRSALAEPMDVSCSQMQSTDSLSFPMAQTSMPDSSLSWLEQEEEGVDDDTNATISESDSDLDDLSEGDRLCLTPGITDIADKEMARRINIAIKNGMSNTRLTASFRPGTFIDSDTDSSDLREPVIRFDKNVIVSNGRKNSAGLTIYGISPLSTCSPGKRRKVLQTPSRYKARRIAPLWPNAGPGLCWTPTDRRTSMIETWKCPFSSYMSAMRMALSAQMVTFDRLAFIEEVRKNTATRRQATRASLLTK